LLIPNLKDLAKIRLIRKYKFDHFNGQDLQQILFKFQCYEKIQLKLC